MLFGTASISRSKNIQTHQSLFEKFRYNEQHVVSRSSMPSNIIQNLQFSCKIFFFILFRRDHIQQPFLIWLTRGSVADRNKKQSSDLSYELVWAILKLLQLSDNCQDIFSLTHNLQFYQQPDNEITAWNHFTSWRKWLMYRSLY